MRVRGSRPFVWSVLTAALSVHCGGNATGDAHQVDHVAPSSDAGRGQAGSSGAAGAPGSGNGGASSTDSGGTNGQSGSGGLVVAGAGSGGATSGGGSAGAGAAGGATAGEAPDGSVTPTCQNQKPQDGAGCTALNLVCGGGCHVCTCEALPAGGAQWKCVALVC